MVGFCSCYNRNPRMTRAGPASLSSCYPSPNSQSHIPSLQEGVGIPKAVLLFCLRPCLQVCSPGWPQSHYLARADFEFKTFGVPLRLHFFSPEQKNGSGPDVLAGGRDKTDLSPNPKLWLRTRVPKRTDQERKTVLVRLSWIIANSCTFVFLQTWGGSGLGPSSAGV